MTKMDEFYRRIYVVEPGHDFSSLASMCREIRFLTTGYEKLDDLLPVISRNLKHFDPAQDAILAVGRVNSCMVTGFVLRGLGVVTFWAGVYNGKENPDSPYQFQQLRSSWLDG